MKNKVLLKNFKVRNPLLDAASPEGGGWTPGSAQYAPKHKLEFLTGRGEVKTVVVFENSGYWMVPEDFGFFGNLTPEEVKTLLQGGVVEPDGRRIVLI